MAIQLPYTREDDMMMGVVNRVAQRRFAMQERHDQNQRYADAKAQAEQAFAWDKEKFEVLRQEERANRAQRNMALQAQQRASDLAYRQQEMEFERQKVQEHSAGYMGKFLEALSSPRMGIDAFQLDGKGELKYDERRLKARAFTPATKEKWWVNYNNNASYYGVKPSRSEFEKMWAIAEREQDKRIYSHVKALESRVTPDVFSKIVGGPEYDAWSSVVNSQIDAKDAMDMQTKMLPAGSSVSAVPEEDSSFFKWARRAANVGTAAMSAAALNKELVTIPKATKLFETDLAKAAQWTSKASKGGQAAARGLAGVAETEGIDKLVEGISKLPKDKMDDAIRGLATKMPLGSLRGLAAKLIKVPEPRTRAIGMALLSLGLLGYDLFFDEE